jgi:hypothetical protein
MTLQKLKTELAGKLTALEQATKQREEAQAAFDERFERFLKLSDNAEIKEQLDKAIADEKIVKDDWKTAREEATVKFIRKITNSCQLLNITSTKNLIGVGLMTMIMFANW